MTRPTIPFDISSTIRDGMRAEANDPVAMAAAVDWLEEQAPTAASVDDRTWLLGQAGVLAGILRQVDRAEAFLREAMHLADEHGLARRSVVMRIRLVDVLALGGDPQAAITLATSLLDDRDALPPDLEDFVHQHLAKALIDVGCRDDAISHLERARALREIKGDPGLLASTLATLEAIRREGDADRGEGSSSRPTGMGAVRVEDGLGTPLAGGEPHWTSAAVGSDPTSQILLSITRWFSIGEWLRRRRNRRGDETSGLP